MTDRDTGVRFDQDPTIDRPLNSATRQFLQGYRASDEYRYGYNLGNLQFIDPDRSGLSELGKRRAIWVQAFAGRLFEAPTINEADRLLEPWMRLGKIHSEIWHPYWNGEHGQEDTHTHYQQTTELFNAVPIPEEIKEYQGDLTDEDLRSMAENLIWLAKDIRESIDLFEGVARPVSLNTIFRAQRIMGQPVVPAGGLEPDVANKPSVRRVELDGKSYIAFDFEGDPADSASEDSSSEEEWQRWGQIEVGTHVQYIRKQPQTDAKTAETGVVHGFHLLGAGDAMLFGPSVANIGIITVNDQTGFFECPLISDIRLDTEQVADQDLEPTPPAKVDVVFMHPQTGASLTREFDSMADAAKEIGQSIEDITTGQERIGYYTPLPPFNN